jgi:hypothetical protein
MLKLDRAHDARLMLMCIRRLDESAQLRVLEEIAEYLPELAQEIDDMASRDSVAGASNPNG